jgi:hypothetical protein
VKESKVTSKTPTSDHSRPRLLGTRAVQLASTILALSHPSKRNKMGVHLPATGPHVHRAGLTDSTSNSLEAFFPVPAAAGHVSAVAPPNAVSGRYSIGIAERGLSDALQVREAKKNGSSCRASSARHWRSGRWLQGKRARVANPCRLVVSRRVSVAVINILDFWAAVATAIYSRFSPV